LRARLANLPAITEADVLARYEATVAHVQIPEQVRARHILVRTSEEASHLLEQIRTRKVAFEAAALKTSASPDAEQGGDLGWFSKGEMPDVFDVCFNLEVGTVSDVVVSDFGFHIFQILERRDARVETLDAVRDRLEEELVRERQSEAVKALLTELRAQTEVRIHQESIDRVVQLLPPAPDTPNLSAPEDGVARALDSHGAGVDPIPALPKN
jgi:peptidyl-prolyl cis-trans isomerase C